MTNMTDDDIDLIIAAYEAAVGDRDPIADARAIFRDVRAAVPGTTTGEVVDAILERLQRRFD